MLIVTKSADKPRTTNEETDENKSTVINILVIFVVVSNCWHAVHLHLIERKIYECVLLFFFFLEKLVSRLSQRVKVASEYFAEMKKMTR
jgi:hypothetical protein